jgi:uncharacterized membrane protein (DUF106 family)
MLLMALFEPAVSIVLTTVALVIVSKILQWKFLDKEKMNSQRQEIKKKQDRAKELLKEGDHKKSEVEKLQTEIMEMTMEMMQASNKMMFISLPVFLLVFFVLGLVYGDQLIVSLLPLPKTFWWNGLPLPNIFEFRMEAGYRTIYIYTYLYISIAVGIVTKIYDNLKKMKK